MNGRAIKAFLLVMSASALAACSALLGLPDAQDDIASLPGNDASAETALPTTDGALPIEDGGAIGDGAVVDAPVPACLADASFTVDPANCGRCGHDCLGGACVANVCQPSLLANGQGGPFDLAVDDTSIYWTNNSANEIVRANKTDGGARTALANSGVTAPWGMAIDGSNVYWANHAFGDAGTIAKCPLSGCPNNKAEVLATSDLAIDVKVDDKKIWFAGNGSGEIRSIDKATGAVSAALITGINQLFQIAIDKDAVYYSSNESQIGRVLFTNGTTTDMGLSDGDRAGGIAIVAGRLFWSIPRDTLPGTVVSKPTPGQSGTQMAYATGTTNPVKAFNPFRIAVDATNVYWTNNGSVAASFLDGSVMTCPIAGCVTPTVLSSGLPQALAIAVDAKAVYFTTVGGGSGTVQKIAKP